ncbi:MAG: 1-(5-phosphoribosyl)-5-[(5-phosphoribosylamino)methylideneamino] imidazole-4-carboxamide isomerase [Acidobacteria bacterium]|nr:1-(5-phosphoribosyl)-5-[(5-phosphoribosylamino)methylideneamino] imidazole-4-carboxamide isomerase [Acidobacteriota bacterium]MDW7983373.1 1-(5-phosphoribosyl)-5-[(5-phosphoribosylamino)methylideneamino] imidazole-4-carboxamide isomerase [Acidobacteriota bacterium]
MLEVIPAMDLMEGHVVRLTQGDFRRVRRYPWTPVEWARHLESLGFRWLHIVDLDGARTGRWTHGPVIAEIRRQTGLRIQVGGGLRTLDVLRTVRSWGIDRVVLGTRAADLAFLRQAADLWEGQVLVALDVRGLRWVVRGWQQAAPGEVDTWLQRWTPIPFRGFLITDTERDGTCQGIDPERVRFWTERVNRPIWWAGGVESVEDLKTLASLGIDSLQGIIVGRALLDGRIDFNKLNLLLQ